MNKIDSDVAEDSDTRLMRKLTSALHNDISEMEWKTAALVTKAIWQPDAAGRVTIDEDTSTRVTRVLRKAGHATQKMADKISEVFNGLVRSKPLKAQTPVSTDEQVLVTKVSRPGKKRALQQKAHEKSEAKARERTSPGAKTLGLQLSKLQRLPKPRTMAGIDEIVWTEAQNTAQKQLYDEFQIQINWEDYYTQMCAVGKVLLASEVQRRSQLIYDYRASKKFSKQNKKRSYSDLS